MEIKKTPCRKQGNYEGVRKLEKRIGQALIITGILLQTFVETPFWLTLCFVTSGFVWMSEPDFGEGDEEE